MTSRRQRTPYNMRMRTVNRRRTKRRICFAWADSARVRVSWWLNTQYYRRTIKSPHLPARHIFVCAGTCNFPTMMTKILIVASIFIGVFVTVQAAAVYPQNCGERMQSQLKELLATKQTCDSGIVHDCCQV